MIPVPNRSELTNSPAGVECEALPLASLFAGQSAVVQSLVGSQDLIRHLHELGIRAGTILEMIRPGGTCILRVEGSKLCIRGDELFRVMVTPLGPGVALA